VHNAVINLLAREFFIQFLMMTVSWLPPFR
jgi:hypothetical protein